MKHRFYTLLLGVLTLMPFILRAQSNIHVTMRYEEGFMIDTIRYSYSDADHIAVDLEWTEGKTAIKGKTGSFDIPAAGMKTILFSAPIRLPYPLFLLPGDSIEVLVKNFPEYCSGKGSEKVLFAIAVHTKTLDFGRTNSNDAFSPVRSLYDYFDWHDLLKLRENIVLDAEKKFLSRLDKNTRDFLVAQQLTEIMQIRITKFRHLWKVQQALKLTDNDLKRIYDTTVTIGAYQRLNDMAIRGSYGLLYYHYNVLNIKAKLMYWERTSGPVLGDRLTKIKIFKTIADTMLKGEAKNNLMTYMITNKGLREGHLQAMADYKRAFYATGPGEEYKRYIQTYENKIMKRLSSFPAAQLPEMELTDLKGKKWNEQVFDKKITLLTFIPFGQPASDSVLRALNGFQQAWPQGVDIVNITTCGNISSCRKEIANLKKTKWYLADSSLLRVFDAEQRPVAFILNLKTSKIVGPIPADQFITSPSSIMQDVKDEVMLQADGPYLFSHASGRTAYTILGDQVSRKELSLEDTTTALVVQGPEPGDQFRVRLKSRIDIEPAVYEQPEKLLALSDIEGNLRAFKNLLVGNGVIDKNYNWTFGKGHLVLTGDMMDRGRQVTECLWLIYSLEEQAKRAGGRVHYILGNHEHMNFVSKSHYVDDKYTVAAKLLKVNYLHLLGPETELGRWLRTKNIMEKIGDHLFVHGGMGPEFLQLQLTLQQVNQTVRSAPEFAQGQPAGYDSSLVKKLTGEEGPLWFRGYYNSDPNHLDIVDQGLRHFGVKKIITGHTIVPEVQFFHDGKVINTDTKHAKGSSGALLIEGNSYYRVDGEGKREAL